jgi:protein tyrosine/serine phosphatase
MVAFESRSVSRRSLAVVFSLLLVHPVIAQTSQAAASPTAPAPLSASSIRIDNFGQVNPAYFRGAQPKGQDYYSLARIGIKTLISLTSDDSLQGERSLAEQAGLKFVKIPMSTRVAPTSDELTRFLEVVNDSVNQPVYVHCVGGRHRTGVMTAVYRMAHDGWSAEQAFKEMKQFKFGADFLHPEFKTFVFGYPTVLAASNTVAQTR